ncbi:hypothetical protein GCM10028802_32490 [Terrabacter terrigena]
MVKRRLHCGHWRRRRMQAPSSVVRESMTRESVWRQNGQCTSGHLPFPETVSFSVVRPSRTQSSPVLDCAGCSWDLAGLGMGLGTTWG